MYKQNYYNEFFELGQQKINFKFYELSLPDDDPAFTYYPTLYNKLFHHISRRLKEVPA